MLNIKKITAGIVTAMLLTGTLGMAVSAQSTVNDEDMSNLTIQKDLAMDKNVTDFPAFTFTFSVEKIDSSNYDNIKASLTAMKIGGVAATEDEKNALIVLENVPDLDDVTVSYIGNEEGTIDEDQNLRIVTATANIDVEGVNFPKAGIYLYKVTEKPLEDTDWAYIKISDTDELTKQSDAEYIVGIAVVNNETTGKLEVSKDNSFVISKTTGQTAEEVVYAKGSLEFENEYQRGSTPPPPPGGDDFDLKIQKAVTGQYGDKTKDFTFEIKINKNATEPDTVISYTAEKWKVDGTEKIEDVTIGVGEVQTFTLKNDEYLLFKDLPVGSTYTLKEKDNAGYQTTVDAKIRSTADNTVTTVAKESNDEFALRTITIGQGENSVAVTNNADLVLTGIVTDNLSFILLIVVAVAGMTAYVVLKRRLRNR